MTSMNGPFDRREDGDDKRSASFMRLFGQMMMLPVTVFIQGMELFIKTIQGMQRATDEGMNVMAGEMPQMSETDSGRQSGLTRSSSEISGSTKEDGATNLKEKTNMRDTDLSGKDTLKLVRYKILFIKRDYETAFPEHEELVSDPMDETAYTAWKIAEFIQRLAKDKTEVPEKWGRKYPPEQYRKGVFLIGFPEDDKKYLRVYYEVLARYDREEFKYHQRQIEVLEEIRDRI